MAPQGRIVLLGLMGGAEARLDLGRLLQRRLRLIGSTMRSRTLAERAQVSAAAKEQLLPLLEANKVQPVLQAVYPFERVAEAVRAMSENRTVGKVVLAWDNPG
jgi:NADPH:quinone reductase-like Zn-dependent oxidoreductase